MATPFPPTLTVTALHDPVIDSLGFDPTADYLEIVTLPVVGPSALWTYRRLSTQLAHQDSYPVELVFLAECIGLGRGTGSNSPICRTLSRLVQFGLAARRDDATLAVRPKAPWLPERSMRRLHPDLQRTHRALLAAHQDQRLAG